MAVQRSAGRLVGIMVLVALAGLFVARSYYGKQNRSVDPRIKKARELYEDYDRVAREGNYYLVAALLDTISNIYLSIPHYRETFELGVLSNNRAAAMLTAALYRDSIPPSVNPYSGLSTDSLADLAEDQILTAIELYEGWISRFQGKNEGEIGQMIEVEFLNGLDPDQPEQNQNYLSNRVKEIQNSLVENQRRLSVSYTNLGLVYRIRGEYPEAVARYEKAILLWDRNLDAENNLNKLLGKPLKRRNAIQKLFPPAKDIKNK